MIFKFKDLQDYINLYHSSPYTFEVQYSSDLASDTQFMIINIIIITKQ